MALPCVRLGAVRLRSGDVYRFLCRSSSHAAEAAQEIEIPKKKSWDKTAVLQALAYTVTSDPTSPGYHFQDDPYLFPKSSADIRVFAASKESGRNSAKFVMDMYPNLFEKDFAEPHIPCLMPESVQPLREEISEEALNERINLRRVQESVNLYDRLLQGGTQPSLAITNKLLDLLCFYGDKEPSEENPESEEQENENEKGPKGPNSKTAPVCSWRANNHAERIFNLMPEKDAHSYRTMIRGMVKHNAPNKAFDMYTDLLNNRLTGDVHTFNALITAAPHTKDLHEEKWAVIQDLLHQMVQQRVQPNLHTFNCTLQCLSLIGQRKMAWPTFNEMRALRIEPSLATFFHLLKCFYSYRDPSIQVAALEEILYIIEGKSFTAWDPHDVYFFAKAMEVCREGKDLKLAYRVDALRKTGDNWKLIGNQSTQYFYFGSFFSIICLFEDIDKVFKWYREYIPSCYLPNINSIMNLLHLVEMENQFERIPQIWRDMYFIGHTNKDRLNQEFLRIMTRQKNSPEIQEEFVKIATSIKNLYIVPHTHSKLQWSSNVLGNVILLLCRGGKMAEVWPLLKYFKSKHLVPESHVLNELMACVKESGNTSVAIDLVQLAAQYSLPDTAKLAETTLKEFSLHEEQRVTLQDLTQFNSSDSSSSDSSSSDSDQE